MKKKFKNWFEYNEYQKNNSNIYENKVIPEIQYLTERYHQISDDDLEIPHLKIFSLDIETYSYQMPNPRTVEDPIVLISITDLTNDIVHVFGSKPYDVKDSELENVTINYHYCEDEQELLSKFLDFMHENIPDIITGWNIIPSKKMNVSGFDMGYIINRCKEIFGKYDEQYKKLSPINEVKIWEDKDGYVNVDIVGVTLIDYLTAYKWYSKNKPESYQLEFVSQLELGVGKLEYEGTLHQLYEENWTKMVDYNIIDTIRVAELEKKLGYIKLIQSLSLITKCPMKNFTTMTSLIEGLMLTHYRRNKLCAPKMLDFTGDGGYSGGHQKEPHKGLWKWLFSIDISSSYPTAIITLNKSLETYIGKIINFSEEKVIEYTSKREFPQFDMHNFYTDQVTRFEGDKLDKFNKMLKRGLVCISPIGVCYKTQPEGVIAHVERTMYEKRQRIKKEMKTIEDGTRKEQLNHMQEAIKTLINSFYGILAYPWNNRYMNVHIAESVTSCGRHAIKEGEKFVNDLLNNPNDKMKEILSEIRSL